MRFTALSATALLATTAHATAQPVVIQGSGVRNSGNGTLGAMQGPTFTFRIVLDSTSPNLSGSGDTFGFFFQAIRSFEIDGNEYGGGADLDEVRFSNSGGFESLTVLSEQISQAGPSVLFQLRLQPNTFGPSPYSIDQLLQIDESSATSGNPTVSINDIATFDSSSGQATSFTIEPAPAPTFTQQPGEQPEDRTRILPFPGDTLSFNVSTRTDTPVTYQWKLDGADLVDGQGVSGSNSRNLTIDINPERQGIYTVIATNQSGSTVSEPVEVAVRAPVSG